MKKETISFSMLIVTAIIALVTATATIFISQIVPVASTQQQAEVPPNALEENNKILVRSAIEDIFNEHNITAVDKYIKKRI